jgi:DNA (cytosine-5)-methyltransferase 1
MTKKTRYYYDFFCGGGMVSYGLGRNWKCVFANDIDRVKADAYRANHRGGTELHHRDIASITASDLPGRADLAWASFPCQDLSLAGSGRGLEGARSGTFWKFWQLIRELKKQRRMPRTLMIENVYGLTTSRNGEDFRSITEAIADVGYSVGALLIDAERFLPQSRPRLFFIAVSDELTIPPCLVSKEPCQAFHGPRIVNAVQALERKHQNRWIWWNVKAPPTRKKTLVECLLAESEVRNWHTHRETRHILEMMDTNNRRKVELAASDGGRIVGTIYRRTRVAKDGQRRQRAEVRFDGIAGCLRTPAGGSSRQTLMEVRGKDIKTRLLDPREAARLMGLPDHYWLSENYNEAYKISGDGVAIPVVRFLRTEILGKLLSD